jgi:hypothetical protein
MAILGSIVLIAIGLLLIGVNAKHLVGDWHRMKPRHNVDWAFIQIIFGVILIVAAWYVGRSPTN